MTVLSTPPHKVEYADYSSTDVPSHFIYVLPVRKQPAVVFAVVIISGGKTRTY